MCSFRTLMRHSEDEVSQLLPRHGTGCFRLNRGITDA